MDLIEFEELVKSNKMYDEHWVYILKKIPPILRKRYLATLNREINMPTAFDLVLASAHVDDEDYYKLLNKSN